MKRFACILLALTALLACGAQAFAEENLLANGDFTEVEGDNPSEWLREMWLTDEGVSLLGVEPDGYDGACVYVFNVDANDARFAQTVAVEPDSLYRISAMVRAEGCDEDGPGASVSVSDVFVYSDPVYDTHGQWDYVELYGRTGPDQKSLTVFCRVGGYGMLSRGSAWFDEVSLTQVDAAPADAVVYDFFRTATSAESAVSTDVPKRYTEAWLLMILLYATAVMGVVRKRGRSRFPREDDGWNGRLILLLACAAVVRLLVAVRVPGYYTDINCFTGWSERIFTVGLTRFYAPDYFCDYPPGYMLLLWPVALLRRLLGVSGGAGYRALLKLLPMLADVAGAWLLWRRGREKLSHRGAFLLAALYAFNPAAIVNCAAWGQIDSILALFIALCALDAADHRYTRALMWFAAALLMKPQALLFAPLGLAAILAGLIRADSGEVRVKRLVSFAWGVLGCLATLYLAGFIFSVRQSTGVLDALIRPVTWLWELYFGTMQGYRYLTVNTLNLYYLLGLNWARMDAHEALSTFAWIMFALGYVFTIALCAVNAKKPRRLMLLGATLIMLISAFGPMMHERYAFPAMLLLALAFAQDRDMRVLASLVGLIVTLFLNQVLVLQGGMTAANYGHLQSSEDWLNVSASLAHVLNALFIGWTCADICLRGHVVPLGTAKREDRAAGEYTLGEPANYRMGLKRVDCLLMAAVTAVYAIVAFVNLGVTKAPQTGWTSSISGETVVFDLGEVRTFRMTYYGGICKSTFAVSLSNDGEHWTEDEVYARYAQGEIFRWIWFVPQGPQDSNGAQSTLYDPTVDPGDGSAYITYASAGDPYPMQTARYVRITANMAGLVLYECAFLDADGSPLPILGVDQYGQTAESASSAGALIDEQNTVASTPSYLNSTYFDEIYHARTAFEQLHGMSIYEYTHPQLGKVAMMLGIKLFGMTPFGWRFMGTLAGVLMLPLIYLLAKQLTKDTRLSMIAMCLLALDSMHFTQTRIATIDSYAVFWIMLMYLFMFRYCQMSWNRESLGRTLVPLGLCGITMGVAWATKWIGIYASAGLAILFFWTFFCRLREARYLRDGGGTAKNAVVTICFCLVFFIVVPAVIYYFSYYWHLRGEGLSGFGEMFTLRSVRRVIEIQKNMFNYHSGLGGDTHYFRSPWYQWPVIWWPMWYYSGTAYMPEGVISSISCMGNPAVWWFGLVAIIYVWVRACWDRRASRKYLLVIVGFASQFLPWVIVPRSTFIYHYFASVPFIILASVLLLDALRQRSRTAFEVVSCVLLAAAAVLFIMFYPLESGLPCPVSYAKYLRWFKWYNY